MRPTYNRRGLFESVMLQHEAVRHGMGIAMLPCAFADTDPDLERLPDAEIRQTHSLWLLRQADTRNTARLKYVADGLYRALSSFRETTPS